METKNPFGKFPELPNKDIEEVLKTVGSPGFSIILTEIKKKLDTLWAEIRHEMDPVKMIVEQKPDDHMSEQLLRVSHMQVLYDFMSSMSSSTSLAETWSIKKRTE